MPAISPDINTTAIPVINPLEESSSMCVTVSCKIYKIINVHHEVIYIFGRLDKNFDQERNFIIYFSGLRAFRKVIFHIFTGPFNILYKMLGKTNCRYIHLLYTNFLS